MKRCVRRIIPLLFVFALLVTFNRGSAARAGDASGKYCDELITLQTSQGADRTIINNKSPHIQLDKFVLMNPVVAE